MTQLNFHHLHYFWVVAREGGLVAASRALRLSHSTLSAQIHALEDALGAPLFEKRGRRLVLTEQGHTVLRYADDIFSLGRELVDSVAGREQGQPLRLDVGIADVVPKLLVQRLLQPALGEPAMVRLVCHEDRHDRLLAALAQHTLHLVLSDAPVPPGGAFRAFNHPLGGSGVTLFGVEALVKAHRRGFPASLDGAPMLLPLETLPLRRALNLWFERLGVTPRVVAEFEDSALMKVLGASGLGLFPAPSVVAREVARQHGVRALGVAEGVRERYYAITLQRRISHPAVVAITEAAGEALEG